MLVRDLGDSYQIVLQPDHADVSGQLAAAWAEDSALSAEVREALVLAATRHDDGWAIWERHPRLDAEGRPQRFLDVPVDSLLSSYRACVEVLGAESPAAGLLVSMHVSGLRRNRYGVMEPGAVATPLEDLRPEVREFVSVEEARQTSLRQGVGFAEHARWRAYWLLQVYDFLSLYFGLADLDRGERREIPGVPFGVAAVGRDRDAHGQMEFVPSAQSPWTVQCDPFPFAQMPTRLQMRRRVVGKHEFSDEPSFRAAFSAAVAEEVEICLIGGSTAAPN